MNEHGSLERGIERLVDGELTAEETSLVLSECEAHPDLWRTLALSLLEAREVRCALGEMLTELPAQNEMAKAATRGRGLTWLLAAACLACLSFLVGRFVPNSVETPQDDSVALIKESDPATGGARNHPNPPGQPDGLTVVGIARIHNLVGHQAPIPVITGPDLDFHALLREPVQVPDELLRRCRNEGLAIQTRRRVMALELADGQRFAVPIDQFGFRYVGNKVL